MTVSPDGAHAYVANGGGASVSQFSRDPQTGLLTALSPATASAGPSPLSVTVSPDGAHAYVANGGGASVSQFSRDPQTGLLTALSPATAPAGPTPLLGDGLPRRRPRLRRQLRRGERLPVLP